MRSVTTSVDIAAPERYAYVDLTEELERAIKDSGVTEGSAVAFCAHTTCALIINEWEDGALEDFRARCLALRSEGVSPLRVSMRIASPMSSTGVSRLRCTSCASAFKGETYSVCRPSGAGAPDNREGQNAARVGRNPASVLPAPVSATSRA